jgi:hypothetical protein
VVDDPVASTLNTLAGVLLVSRGHIAGGNFGEQTRFLLICAQGLSFGRLKCGDGDSPSAVRSSVLARPDSRLCIAGIVDVLARIWIMF